MEYVEGVPITRHCDERALPLRARLGLFLDVCAAVQYAHAQLVVHRDIKSANVLVRADELAKLLDFGIAMHLADDHGEASASGIFLSPHSAAPEQFSSNPVGVAADVYALGVLLCELAGGTRPIDVDGLDADAAMDHVLHAQPRLPGTTVDDEAARRRGGITARTLRRALHGDIDAIVARCLAKDPQRRYASVAALTDDIERHLSRRPIAIRAHERVYRMRRFLRRHAVAVGFAALAASLLLGFIAYGVTANGELARQRDEARQREREALFQQSRARAAVEFLVDLFRSTSPERTRGHLLGPRELLDRGRARLDTGLATQPGLRATMLSALSDVYFVVDDFATSRDLAQRAFELRESGSANVAEVSESQLQLARLANADGKAQEALDRVNATLALGATLDIDHRSALLEAEASALEGLAKAKEATPVWRENLALVTDEYGEDHPRTLHAGIRLATNFRTIGLADEAVALLADVLPRARARLEADDPALVEILSALAVLTRDKGDASHADMYAREALALSLSIYGEHSSQASSALNTLTTIADARGKVDEAIDLVERSLRIRIDVYGADSLQVAVLEYNLGLLLQVSGKDPEGALRHLQVAVATGERHWRVDHVNLATYRLALGSSLRELGRHDEARAALRSALATFERMAAPRGVNKAMARAELACDTLAQGPDAAADAELANSLRILDRYAASDPQTRRIRTCAASTQPRRN
jgi:serine/threonine-protein kinase